MNPCVVIITYKLSDDHPGHEVPNPDKNEGGEILVPDAELFRDVEDCYSQGAHFVVVSADGDTVGIHQDDIASWAKADQGRYDEEAVDSVLRDASSQGQLPSATSSSGH